MNIWNGVFAPTMQKHRDHMHNHDVVAHCEYKWSKTTVDVAINPITQDELEEPEPYWIARVKWPGSSPTSDKEYDYLIPAGKHSPPTHEEFWKTMKEYAKHPVIFPRDIWDYIVGQNEFEHIDIEFQDT